MTRGGVAALGLAGATRAARRFISVLHADAASAASFERTMRVALADSASS